MKGLRCGLLILAIGVVFPAAAHAVGPYPTNLCAGDRVSGLKCTANDVELLRLEDLNGTTSCVAGQPVTLNLRAHLRINAKTRHDIGLFVARDGKSPARPSADGGSADCAVFGLPQAPTPFADLDGNACGDFDRGKSPVGTATRLDLGPVTVHCVPDVDGRLNVQGVITWQQNASTCNAPPAAWLEPGTKASCDVEVVGPLPVLVQGRIVVTKRTEPPGEPDTFAVTASGPEVSPIAFSLGDGQSQTIVTAPLSSTPQTYTITEAPLAGWDPTAQIRCTDALGNPASFATIDPTARAVTAQMSVSNAELFCVVRNKEIGTANLTVNTSSIGGDGTFGFTGSMEFTITTLGGSGSSATPSLAPGIYSVVESPIAGWSLTSIVCSGAAVPPVISLPARSATITAGAGENVVCTFTNTKTGSITVQKIAVGGDFRFGYVTTGSGLSSFSVVTAGGAGAHMFDDLLPGAYSVTEVTPAGWTLTALGCTGTAIPASIVGGAASLTLGAGEDAVCIYTNTQQSSLTVNKLAEGDDDTFPYTVTGASPFAITTSGNVGEQILDGLTAGVYTVTEGALAGWNLAGIRCHGTAAAPVISVPGRSATVTIAAGEDAVCAFTNTRHGSITIVKDAGGADVTFSYAATGVELSDFTITTAGGSGSLTFTGTNGLPPGQYSVTELALSGWTLVDVTCTGTTIPATIAGPTASIQLGPGEDATCTYSNSKLPPPGSITVDKETVGGDATFPYTVTGLSPFTITTAGGIGQHRVSGLAAGTYVLTEAALGGWNLTALSCSGTATPPAISLPARSATITLAAGETIACEYTNVRTASITIKKATAGGDASFGYTVTGGPADFTITTSGGAGSHLLTGPNGLAPGGYSVTEAAIAGWDLTDLRCTGTAIPAAIVNGTVTITLGGGEAASCTYTNVKHGASSASLTIDTSAVGGDGSFRFTTTGAGLLPFTLTTAGGTATRAFSGLAPGVYSVTPLLPGGWTLTGVVCVGMATPPSVVGGTVKLTLAAGEHPRCTFASTRQSAATRSIIINKVTQGGDGVFAYTSPGITPFKIVTSSGEGQQPIRGLSASTYTITEVVARGWTLISVTCAGTAAPATIVDATVNLTVAPGERAVCTFVSARKADNAIGRALLFPFVTTETGKFTFLTIANDGAGAFGGPPGPPSPLGRQLLFTYGTKPVPIVNKAGCEHFDGFAGTTDADMMVFEVGRKVTGLAGATALFEPGALAPPTSTPLALPLGNRVGFLIVESSSADSAAQLFGTAAVVDVASGLTWTYSTNWLSSRVRPPNFRAIDGGNYSGGAPVGAGGVGQSGFKSATWFPTGVVSTSWYVLPLGDRATMAPPEPGGIRLGLRTATDHLPAPNVHGAYDLDERFFSGGSLPLVRCLGLLTRSDLLPSGVAAATAHGGFTFVAGNGDTVTLPGPDPADSGGVYTASPFSLFKLQTSTVFGAPKATINKEPDHNPCFNPDGVFPVPGSCAGY